MSVTIKVPVTTTFGVMTKIIVNDWVSRFFSLTYRAFSLYGVGTTVQPVEHLVHELDCSTHDNHCNR